MLFDLTRSSSCLSLKQVCQSLGVSISLLYEIRDGSERLQVKVKGRNDLDAFVLLWSNVKAPGRLGLNRSFMSDSGLLNIQKI